MPEQIDISSITLGQFDRLAKQFGYVSRVAVEEQWAKAMEQLAANMKQQADTVVAVSNSAEPGGVAAVAAESEPAKDDFPASDDIGADAQPEVKASVEPPKGRRRPAAAKAAEPPAEASKPPLKGEVMPPAKGVTTDDVRAALTRLVAAKGMTAGRDLLTKFGAAKASEVPADKCAAFVAEADAQAGA